MTSTIPRQRQYLRGLTVIVAAAVAGMIALSGQNAEASALPGSSSHSSAVTLNVASHQDASRAEHKKKHQQKLDQKKHPKRQHAKQQQSSSGAGQDQSGSNAQGTNADQQTAAASAAAKQAAQQAAAQQAAAADRVAAANLAAAKKQAAAVKQAKATKAAAAARKASEQARIKAAKASGEAALSAAVPTAVSPILVTTQVDTGSPSQSTVTGPTSAQKAAQAKPATGASPNKRPNTAAIRPLPTQLVWIGHITSGIAPMLLAAFVLVFGFGLVLGGTTRRMAHRTR